MPLGARSPAAQAESLPLYRWLLDRRAECRMAVERVPLSGLEGWTADPATGEIRHARGGFFSVVGIRVTDASGREVSAWSQPILEQSEPGVLGLVVRTGPDGDEYLVGAKPEPGHPEKVLLGPTLQATLSNLKGLHGGRGIFADISYF